MKQSIFFRFYTLIFFVISLIITTISGQPKKIVFAMTAEQEYQLNYIVLFAESIKEFAGEYNDTETWVYTSFDTRDLSSEILTSLAELNVTLKTIDVPEKAQWYYFASKAYAAVAAESEALGNYDLLAWLNFDTVVLKEPAEFILPTGKNLGYRPVMHRNIGLGYKDKLDEFWARSFELMNVDESRVFPMVTPADQDTIKPYINAGCLIVRPERGIFKNWADNFELLYKDVALRKMCEQSIKQRIFIHQAALTGTLLSYLNPDEYFELYEKVNYPLFFNEMFGSKKDFHDITDVVTFRHEAFFNNPVEGWQSLLKGKKEQLEWLINNLGKTGLKK